MVPQGFPNGVDWWGGTIWGKWSKLHENDKINILGSKQWRGGGGHGGDKPIFWVVEGIPPPTRGNDVASSYLKTERRNITGKCI